MVLAAASEDDLGVGVDASDRGSALADVRVYNNKDKLISTFSVSTYDMQTDHPVAVTRNEYHAVALVRARICNNMGAAWGFVNTAMCYTHPCPICSLRLFPLPQHGLNDYVQRCEAARGSGNFAVTMSRDQLQLRNRCPEHDGFEETWDEFDPAYFHIVLPDGHYEYGPAARYSGLSLSHAYVHIRVTLEDNLIEVVITRNQACTHDIPIQPPGHVFCYLPLTEETRDVAWTEEQSEEELDEMPADMTL